MTDEEIADLLDEVCCKLTDEARSEHGFPSSQSFEDRTRELLREQVKARGKELSSFREQDFPDIVVDDWGIEVKHTKEDKWRTVANSVFEGHRQNEVARVFLIFAKMGGEPEVKWARYEDSVVHVRTSHRPRYEVEIGAETSLFAKMDVSYGVFRAMSEMEKMVHIRRYARSRLQEGEQLWWLGDDPSNPHSLPIAARLYIKLSREEKFRLRAEAAFLCPEIFRGGRQRDKYNRAALYLLTYHGVVASQARDLFTAGSVAHPGNTTRGGRYVLESVRLIQSEIAKAAEVLDGPLIEEYWGEKPPASAKKRIALWLKLIDKEASSWKPSLELFTNS